MNVKVITWNVRGLNRAPKRNLVKSLIHKWKADVYCLQETKLDEDVELYAKQLWECRWMRCGFREAEGSKGGIIMLWDSRVWTGNLIAKGSYSIFYNFVAAQHSFSWNFTCLYAPHTRPERQSCWEEISTIRGLWEGPWVVCGDFNINRFMVERRNSTRISPSMSDISEWIEDMELIDPPPNGGKFTWFKGVNHNSASRIDRFLYSMDWEESFRHIKQKILPRVQSDHTPLLFECGN